MPFLGQPLIMFSLGEAGGGGHLFQIPPRAQRGVGAPKGYGGVMSYNTGVAP